LFYFISHLSSSYSLHPESPAHLPRLSSTRTGSSNILRPTIRVCDCTWESNEAVELIRQSLVPISTLNSGSSTFACGNSGVVCLADIGQLVAKSVGDDVGIQGFSLTAAS